MPRKGDVVNVRIRRNDGSYEERKVEVVVSHASSDSAAADVLRRGKAFSYQFARGAYCVFRHARTAPDAMPDLRKRETVAMCSDCFRSPCVCPD